MTNKSDSVSHPGPWLVLTCLFGSGFCALLYQMTWLREFRLVFGTSTAATAAVTMIFMAGLGLGSLLLGRKVDDHPRPLQLCARLELVVALSAAATPVLLWLVRMAYIALGGTIELGMFGGTAVRLLLAGIVLLVPTFFLGGTLPAAVKALQTEADEYRRSVAWAYGINTSGAVTGTLVSTFVLLEHWGNRGTLWAGCLLNLVVAGAAFWLSRRRQDHVEETDRTTAASSSSCAHVAADAGTVTPALETARSKPTPGPSQEGNDAPKAAPLLGGVGGTAVELASGPSKRNTLKRGHQTGLCAFGVHALACLGLNSTAEGVGGGLRGAVRETSPENSCSAFLIAVATLSGLAFFLMELVWYRMLSPLLGGSTFSFGLILAVALAGTAAGSVAYGARRAKRPAALEGLAWMCGLEALCLAAPLAVGDWLAVFALALQPVGQLGGIGQAITWGVVTLLVVFPAAFCAGILFPMLISLIGRGRPAVGSQTGLVYAWNTVGAMAGSLAGGFGLLPWLSAPGVWRLVVVMLALTAAAVLWMQWRTERRVWDLFAPTAASVVAVVLLTATGPTATWRHSPIGAQRVETRSWAINDYRNFIQERRRALHWEAEGRESGIALTRNDGFALLINGKSDGNARLDAGTQVMLGLLGAMVHPRPTTSLVVGLGTGTSAGWLADVPTMERVDVVELEPAVVEAAGFCAAVNRGVTRHPKVKIHIADAREFVLVGRQTYDLIASEPSNPYRAGVAGLFTREFYQAVDRRLRPGGLFVQWVQAYEMDGSAFSMVYATLTSVFPQVDTWRSQSGDLLLLCSREPLEYDLPALKARIAQEPFRSALASAWRIMDVEGVFARFVANAQFAKAVAAQSPVRNTDDKNRLEFSLARSLGGECGFNLDALTRMARAQGYNPLLRGGTLDWETVADRCGSAEILDGGSESLPVVSRDFQARLAAKQAYLRGDLAGVCRHWKSQSREPGDLIELMIVAQSLARERDKQAPAYIERLRPWHPSEADALMAQYLCLRGSMDEGLALLEKAFANWETNPWATPRLVRSSIYFAKAAALESKSSAYRLRLYQALQKPFAVHYLDEARMEVLFELCQHLHRAGLSAPVQDWLKSVEPNVPWTQPFLELRVASYEQSGATLAKKARQDLDKFKRAAGRPLMLALPPTASVVYAREKPALPLPAPSSTSP